MSSVIKLIFTLCLFTALFARADITFTKSNMQRSIDVVTLNELNQEAEQTWNRRDLTEMIQFKETVNQYLESSIANISEIVSSVDNNWAREVYGREESSTVGNLHPYLVHTFFDIIVPSMRQYEKRKASWSCRSCANDYYDVQTRYVGYFMTGESHVSEQDLQNVGLKISEIKSDVIWSKKAVFVYFLLASSHAQPCSADLTPIDYLSATWGLQNYINTILPNRFISAILNGDKCSKQLYEQSPFDYGDRLNKHADITFGNIKKLQERK